MAIIRYVKLFESIPQILILGSIVTNKKEITVMSDEDEADKGITIIGPSDSYIEKWLKDNLDDEFFNDLEYDTNIKMVRKPTSVTVRNKKVAVRWGIESNSSILSMETIPRTIKKYLIAAWKEWYLNHGEAFGYVEDSHDYHYTDYNPLDIEWEA